MPRRNIAETLSGALVILLAGAFLAYAITRTGRDVGGGYPLHAAFTSVEGLGVGSDVRMAGVKVGSVTGIAIDPRTFEADVTFRVADDIRLPKDSSATITSEGLLGGKYLGLAPGGDERILPPGGTLTITQGSVNIEELLGKFVFSAANLASPKPAPQGSQGGGTGSGQAGGSGGGLPPLGGKP